GTNGSLTGTSPQTVNHGSDGSAVTAVPNAGYHFVQWSDGVPTASRTELNVTANVSVTANFAINQYTLTYTAGTNGSLTGTSPQTVNHGADGSAVTAVPDLHYHFVNWSDGATANPRTDLNVTASLSLTANFAIDTYTLTYAAGAHGTLSGTSPQTVNHGADGSAVTAVPDLHYHFVNWSDGATANPRTDLNVTANVSVTANFAIDTYTLTYTAGVNGSLTGTSPQTVNHGSDGSAVTAVPSTGYHFVQWSDGVPTASRTDQNVTGNISVTADFAINQYTLSYTAGTNGSLTGTSPQTVNHGSDGSAVTAVPNTGYHFGAWSDGVTTASRTELNVTANVSVTASFVINTYTVTPSAGANGSLSPATPQTVTYNTTAVFTVTPATGYHIDAVTGCGSSLVGNIYTSEPITAHCTVTASFAINTYTLAYTAGANGSLTGTSPQTVNYGSSGAAVTAVPSTGYHFVQWSDGVTTATRTDQNVTASISVTATFAINTYAVTPAAGANGSLSPGTAQTVNYGATKAFTVTPATGYHIDQVTGCGGTLVGNTYTTGAVTADCTVTASFAINTYTVTPSVPGGHGSLSPAAPQTVNYNATTAFTVTAATGYRIATVSGCGGTLVGNTYSTGAITSNCTVTAGFIENQPPIVSNTQALPVAVNNTGTVTASISDATTGGSGISGAYYTVDGGTTHYPMSAASGYAFGQVTINVTASITGLTTTDVKQICVYGTDAANNSSLGECVLLAVYDPKAGFVTGGGWIMSPVGAYTIDPTLSGKATFGFVSKYVSGKTVPTGNTEFQFHAANMNFSSTVYEWLVVSGPMAQYKGSGTINGSGNYGFLLSAVDGNLAGGGGSDKFRIKIWDKATGNVVYDNMLGASDTSTPTTVIGGGSIQIQTK
ncbi:MAG TPA: InlB B-repeat-containing protein, partial [Gemmatimonadales bacterium]